MKSTIIGTTDISGGAARAMFRLHLGLLSIGEQSRILCRSKSSPDVTSMAADQSCSPILRNPTEAAAGAVVQDWIEKSRTPPLNTTFSFAYPGWDLTDHYAVRDADIINLHWVAGFQSPATIETLIATGKPIVWTLHDEWAFTGGCHYTGGCDGFTRDCAHCPQIGERAHIPVQTVLADKIAAFDDRITVVTPSEWLAGSARKSSLFKKSRVEVIPYSLQTDVFTPTAKQDARSQLGLPAEPFTLLFGAESANERRKGFPELVEALHRLAENPQWRRAVRDKKVHLLLFGQPAAELADLSIPFTSVGQVKDDTKMALVYSAADLFVLPSLEDNLPNTMLESLSCETPIVAFRVGGMVDIVREGETGYLAEFKNPASLAERILHAYQNEEERRGFGRKGRLWMEKDFCLPVQAERYRSLYEELNATPSPSGSDTRRQAAGGQGWANLLSEQPIQEEMARKALCFGALSAASMIYLKTDTGYDYGHPLEQNAPLTPMDSDFCMRFSLPKEGIDRIEGFIWMPMWKTPGDVQVDSIVIEAAVGSAEIIVDFASVDSTAQKRAANRFTFFHGHGMFVVRQVVDGPVSITIRGKWRSLTTWEAYSGVKEMLDLMNTGTQEAEEYVEANRPEKDHQIVDRRREFWRGLLRRIPFLSRRNTV